MTNGGRGQLRLRNAIKGQVALESSKCKWIFDSTLNLQPTEEELKEGDPTERAGLYEGDIDMAYHEVCEETQILELSIHGHIKRSIIFGK